jgi:hypothetical protein
VSTASRVRVVSGWGWPAAAEKAHYFHLREVSLCKQWRFKGRLEIGRDQSPDNCDICKKLYAELLAKMDEREPDLGDLGVGPFDRSNLKQRRMNVGRSKGEYLSMEEALEIYHLKGKLPQLEVAERFRCSRSTVCDIWRCHGRYEVFKGVKRGE